ncbi:MAG: hypothetical protein P8102_06165 [Gammaproteobacteria bacterium]
MRAKVWILCCVALVAACAGSRGPAYPESQAGTAWAAHEGEIVSLREVTLSGEETALGTIGGGAIGYAIGRSIGSGSGSRVAGAVGGVAGVVAGGELESAARTRPGLEITVALDRGDTVVVVQPADTNFVEGERVRVLLGRGDQARVNPL